MLTCNRIKIFILRAAPYGLFDRGSGMVLFVTPSASKLRRL
jgi:hypothetical protein